MSRYAGKQHRLTWGLGVLGLCLLAAPQPGWSQGGGGSLFPQNNSGGSGGGSTGGFSSGGSSGFGGGGTGNSGFGSSGLGGQGSGGFGQGTGGLGGGTGFGAAAGGLNQQNGGFIGRNNDVANFIGRAMQGQAGATGGQNAGGRNRGGGGNRQLDPAMLNQMNGGQGGGTGQQPTIRPRLKTGFSYPAANVAEVVTSTKIRFDKLTTRHPQLSQVNLAQGENGTVILSGQVDSEAVAKLAERLVRLEPGVRKIQNDLAFPPPSPE